MMHERARKPANVSTISGKRPVRSLPGREYSCTRGPPLRAMILKPSCLTGYALDCRRQSGAAQRGFAESSGECRLKSIAACRTIAQCLNLEHEIHDTASKLCILGFEPLK